MYRGHYTNVLQSDWGGGGGGGGIVYMLFNRRVGVRIMCGREVWWLMCEGRCDG